MTTQCYISNQIAEHCDDSFSMAQAEAFESQLIKTLEELTGSTVSSDDSLSAIVELLEAGDDGVTYTLLNQIEAHRVAYLKMGQLLTKMISLSNCRHELAEIIHGEIAANQSKGQI